MPAHLSSPQYAPVYFFIAFVAVMFIISRISAVLQRRRLAQIAASFQGEIVAGMFGVYFLGCRNSRQFKVKTTQATRNNPAKLHISLLLPCPFKLQIMRENIGSAIFKKIGLVKDVQTGDASFDSEFVLSSDNAAMVQTFFSSQDTKNSVRSLSLSGFALNFDANGITAVKPHYKVSGDMTAPAVEAVLVQLDVLAQRMAG